MKKTLIVVLVLIAQSAIFSNKYPIVAVNGNEILVKRKSDTLLFYYVFPGKVNINDSIRLWSDYDFNYKKLKINN